MKKIISIIVVSIVILVNCKNTTMEKSDSNSSNSIAKEKIDARLVKELNRYIEFLEERKLIKNNGSDSIELYFVLEFTQDKKRVNFYAPPYEDLDPIALFSYNCEYLLYNDTGYKGVIKLNNYFIVIIDPDNIGKNFYDEDALEYVEVGMLKCIESDDFEIRHIESDRLIMVHGVKIRGDSIAPWIFP